MTLEIKFEFDEPSLAKLDKAMKGLNFAIADKSLRAAGKPIVERAKMLAPSSRRSKSREKWSEKYRSKANYQNDSGKEIGLKYLKNPRGGVLYVGAKYPKGNKLQFSNPIKKRSRRVFYWGKDAGFSLPLDPDRFLVRAVRETKAAQLSEFNRAIDSALKEVGLG